MEFSRKQLLVISTVIILLATSSITFAYIFVSHKVYLSGGVSTEGAVVTYKEDGSLLEAFDFEDFHPTPFVQSQVYNFVIENVGNSLCYVTWEIGDSSVSWTPLYYEAGDNWYYGDSSDPLTVNLGFWVETPSAPITAWDPAGYGYITLDVGESALYRFVLHYRGLDNAATDFTIDIHFATTDVVA